MKLKKSEIGRQLMQIDLFGDKPAFHIDGESSYPSISGVVFSLIIYCTMIAYCFKKLTVMLSYEDTNYKTVVEESLNDSQT